MKMNGDKLELVEGTERDPSYSKSTANGRKPAAEGCSNQPRKFGIKLKLEERKILNLP